MFKRLDDEIGGAANIRLDEGFVRDDELLSYFNAADVFVLPVRHILNSSSIALAISFGLPCIAPALGGLEEMLGHDGGIFYDPMESRGLLAAMEAAMKRSHELRAMGRGNLQRARESNWASVAARTAAFYRCVMGGGACQPNERGEYD